MSLILPNKTALVVIDGRNTVTISEKDRITIRKAKTPARFVKTREGIFYEKVMSKLA